MNADSHNKIVELNKYAKDTGNYRDRLKKLADELNEMSESCFTASINLAVLGKWKEWDRSMPVGSNFTFSEDQLLDTGDEFVTSVTQLRIDMLDLIERINKHLSNTGRD